MAGPDAAAAAPPVTGIDHVAIRTRSLEDTVRALVDGLGFVETGREVAPDGRTAVAYVRLGDWDFEVFESDGEPGLDHVAIRVDDLDAATGALEHRGVRPQGGEVAGTRTSRAQVLDPATTAGVRMHLCQRPGPGDHEVTA